MKSLMHMLPAVVLAGALVPVVQAQTTLDFPLAGPQPYQLDSGLQANLSATPVVVFEERIEVPGSGWLRLYFGEVVLAPKSVIRITSLTDGEVQELGPEDLAMWNNTSAYFNGDTVTLELIAAANSTANRLVTEGLASQTDVAVPTGSCGICGPDDRVQSEENWSCRLVPAGCRASIWHPDSCVVSAGHCIGSSDTIQFLVPDSSPNCSLNHPPVAEQFPIVQTDFNNGGVGNDWAVMRSGTNNQGQKPYERYGLLRPIADSPPVTGQSLTIWGYGIDSQCTRSQTQQTSSGSVVGVSSLFFNHDVDATFGNSGSGVTRNAEILGIATHCPCPNVATRVDHPDFEAAREAMCPAPELDTTSLPFLDPFPSLNVDNALWTGNDGATVGSRGITEPSPALSLNLNGSFVGGDRIRTAIMDASGVSDLTLSYWYEAGGTDDPPELGDDLVVEYLNSSEQWIEINRHFGTGQGMTDYIFETVSLPAAAQHANFRVQFRNTSDENPPSLDDDWFVDNVCVGSEAFCLDPFECTGAGQCGDAVDCTVDACVDGFCLSTEDDAACDDGVGCTADSCNAVIGCVNTADDGLCDDGVACTVDTCDSVMDCMSGPNDNLCDDADACTLDVCDPVNGCEYTPLVDCSGVEGLITVDATDAGAAGLGLSVCNVYVQFGSPDDKLLSLGFSDINTNDPAGFHQDPLGTDTAPGQPFVDMFPELAYDSYVDIGYQVVPTGVTDSTSLDPDFDSSQFNNGGALSGGWFNSNPVNDQGQPDASKQVFIAQFTVNQGFAVSGIMTVFFNDGTQGVPASFECAAVMTCPADLNGDGMVDALDLAELLGAWGPCPGCPADLSGDETVDAFDLAQLLGAWGPC